MPDLSQSEILRWLREERPERLQDLYAWADAIRRQNVGEAVHLRGLIEISSHCRRQCMYCGLRKANRSLERYRMTREEIEECAQLSVRLGYGTVVIQAGEDDMLTAKWIAEIVAWIKRSTPLAVTLSLGERSEEELRLWRSAGADRYLLRFETSDPDLFRAIHPSHSPSAPDRLAILRQIKRLGYEAGGGVMVGIPGQSYQSVAQDVLTFRALDLDMIGIGPYIAHPSTPLGSGKLRPAIHPAEQTPGSEQMVYKMIALTRILCPDANIPSTTALATINRMQGRKQGLQVGANVVMPNLTPVRYRPLYQIYPAKACIEENAIDCNQCLRGQISSLGRFPGRSTGGRGEYEVDARILASASSQLVQLRERRYGI
ncbi:MAG TPA: [FeFe] hydrogenase H-cluster radical SAM maturase HydE [Terracidiphilus sp.]|nr:[FeFe] hydrogenase H-cluster radical SAM maturase HydE [Terracidiphilus sp.]